MWAVVWKGEGKGAGCAAVQPVGVCAWRCAARVVVPAHAYNPNARWQVGGGGKAGALYRYGMTGSEGGNQAKVPVRRGSVVAVGCRYGGQGSKAGREWPRKVQVAKVS